MGKKRTVQKKGGGFDSDLKARALSRAAKKKVAYGTLHIQSTYNNTRMLLSDKQGNALSWSSSGSLGFKGTKKGTPFAAAKVGELLGERAQMIGVKSVNVIMKGVGSGRESSLRSFASKGIEISSISDETPIPFNGPRPPKPRRV
ncbi:MAG: 30S ribosomal protein S11 [Parcubacteria group bacterium]|nr:30S ribosomal protein S11 [Parcubacteria group bacterium]MBI3075116.1 30S ribosomal protein S11 [Parcubacteria group bacterium]